MIEKHNFSPRLIMVLSSDSFIYDALVDNINCKIELVDSVCKDYMNSLGKIDVLIVDKSLFGHEIPSFRVDILINCTKNKISQNEIYFAKPFKLADLIDAIERNQDGKNLFCSINKDWVYSQQLGKLSSVEKSIFLTDKENILFQKLLCIDGHLAEKDYLRHEVWSYHQDAESNTVETHLYKLKQKLPPGLLEIKNSSCFLSIDTLK
jgi:hypothetical protein